MASRPSVTLYLADGKTHTHFLDPADSQGDYYRLLNGEGEYASGWLEIAGGYMLNLRAVVRISPSSQV